MISNLCHRYSPVRSLLLSVLLLTLGLGLSGSARGAGPLPGQEGLPPELVISGEPPLEEQLSALEPLTAWVQEQKPSGGTMDRIRSWFSGPDRAPLVNLEDLPLLGEALQGKQIAVQGLLESGLAPDRARLVGRTTSCLLTFAPGMVREGLPEETDGLPVRAEGVAEVLPNGVVTVRAQKLQPGGALAWLRLGRVRELQELYPQAVAAYQEGAKLGSAEQYRLAAFGATRAAELTLQKLNERKAARGLFTNAWTQYTGRDARNGVRYYTWTPTEESFWRELPVAEVIGPPLREINQEIFWYRLVDAMVTLSGGHAGIGLILLALLTRVLVYPLTKKQMASARDMQRLQPEIKRLQERLKGDKQKFQEEFWKLCREHGVNPLGGCLPLLVQMPLLYFVYMGIRAYIVNLDDQSFLWVGSLAQPDLALLILYTVSQIAFGKLTQSQNPQAAMDPQQRQQQQMMTYLMPLMFFFLFQSFPAGFMLYWLGTNVFYITQQFWYNRSQRLQTAPAEPAEARPATKPGRGLLARLLGGSRPPQERESGPSSYQQKKAAQGGKLTNRQEAEQRRKKRRWPPRRR